VDEDGLVEVRVSAADCGVDSASLFDDPCAGQ
jgi:hypothetical protein